MTEQATPQLIDEHARNLARSMDDGAATAATVAEAIAPPLCTVCGGLLRDGACEFCPRMDPERAITQLAGLLAKIGVLEASEGIVKRAAVAQRQEITEWEESEVLNYERRASPLREQAKQLGRYVAHHDPERKSTAVVPTGRVEIRQGSESTVVEKGKEAEVVAWCDTYLPAAVKRKPEVLVSVIAKEATEIGGQFFVKVPKPPDQVGEDGELHTLVEVPHVRRVVGDGSVVVKAQPPAATSPTTEPVLRGMAL